MSLRSWIDAAIWFVIAALVSSMTPSSAWSQVRTTDPNAYVEALARERQFSGGVLVISDGRVVLEAGYGLADRAMQEANTSRTRFPYASISKLFTATAIFQLVEAGKVELDAPAARYLPGFPYPAITIRTLLNHSSGLPPFSRMFGLAHAASPQRVFTNRDFVALLAADPPPLLYPPGSSSTYDNANFTVLALVVEAASGEPYPEYVARHILEPAGMTDTRFVPIGRQMAGVGEFPGTALPYYFPTRFAETPILGSAIQYAVDYHATYAFNGYGDYVGTLQDVARFSAAYDRLVGPELRTQAFSVSRMSDGQLHPNRIGLSWYVGGDTTRGVLVFHAGASLGLACVLVRSVERDETIVIFSNSQADVNGIAFDITRILAGQAVDLPRKSLALSYTRLLLAEGPTAATDFINVHRADASYVYDEAELNVMGYDLLAPADPYKLGLQPDLSAALEVFKTNLADHPESWNAYDSYGEALGKAGRRREAITMYRRSLELHDNPGGRRALETLTTAP